MLTILMIINILVLILVFLWQVKLYRKRSPVQFSLRSKILRKATPKDKDSPYIQTSGESVSLLGEINGLILKHAGDKVLVEIFDGEDTVGYRVVDKWW